MKNIINVNVTNFKYYTLTNEDDGTNSIFVQFANVSSGATCEVFYGDSYYEEIEIPSSGLVEIPEFCYSDGSNMRFRYQGATTTSFIHIVGNASLYDDMTLENVSDTICAIGGSLKDEITYDDGSLKPATRTKLGGVKVGAGLNVKNDGTLSTDVANVTDEYDPNGSDATSGRAVSKAVSNLKSPTVYKGMTVYSTETLDTTKVDICKDGKTEIKVSNYAGNNTKIDANGVEVHGGRTGAKSNLTPRDLVFTADNGTDETSILTELIKKVESGQNNSFSVKESPANYSQMQPNGKFVSSYATYKAELQAQLDGLTMTPFWYSSRNIVTASGNSIDKNGRNITQINNNLSTLKVGENSGGINLLKYNATSQTINGVTFTVNADKTITVNGTASGNANFYISTFELGFNGYRLVGCPSGVTDKAYIQAIDTTTWEYYVNDTGNGANITSNVNAIRITVLDGKTLSNVVFKPMLTTTNATYNDYEPFIPSVKMLSNAEEQLKYLGYTIPSEFAIDVNKVNRIGLWELDYRYVSSYATPAFQGDVVGAKGQGDWGSGYVANAYSYKYNIKSWSSLLDNTNSKGIAIAPQSSGEASIAICDTTYTDVETFKQAMKEQNVYIYYETIATQNYTDGKEAITQINDSIKNDLYPKTYTVPTYTNATHQGGGYARFGNFVMIATRFLANSSSVEIKVPKPIDNNSFLLLREGNNGTLSSAYMQPNSDTITIGNLSAGVPYQATCTYLTND